MELAFASKARENIEAAELLFESQKYNACANRSYYAAFHAGMAALINVGIAIIKISHESLQGKFSGELIRRRKIYPNKFRPYLMDLQAVRDDADYEPIFVSKKVASRQLRKAKEFVVAIEKEISK